MRSDFRFQETTKCVAFETIPNKYDINSRHFQLFLIAMQHDRHSVSPLAVFSSTYKNYGYGPR